MWCPLCDKPTQVIDTRKYQDISRTFDFVERRRICRDCGHTFSSIEITKDLWEKHYRPEQEENEDA
jgi:transcriptional regulator NrdR family protein